jgi:hypothetical protein
MTLMDPAILDDEPTRADLCEALSHHVHAAKREMPVVRRLTTDPPTPWERRHASIDQLLTDLEALGCDATP